MKKIACLAAGICAALWSGVLHGAKLYLNPLVGSNDSVFVPSGTYGRTTTTGENGEETVTYAGLTLPANVIGKSFSRRTSLSASDPGASGTVTDMIKEIQKGTGTNPDTNVATHTVMGWFKIDSLPTSGNYQMLWAARSLVRSSGALVTGDHAGYRVCVTSAGELAIGKVKYENSNFSFSSDGSNEPVLSSGAGIVAGTWYHIAVTINTPAYTTAAGRVGEPTFYVNGKAIALATSGATFKVNLAGNKCGEVVTGQGISAAGFYVDDAVMSAEAIRTQAVDPTKHIYAAQWTRNVPGGGWWRPTSEDFYPWSADGMTLDSTNPLVYRGSVTLSVTTTTEASDSTISLNASPSLTAFTTAYRSGCAGTLTLSPSDSNTLTAETTTISAKTVLSGTGFSLGNLSITSTGSLSVGTNRDFTLTSIADGSNKLSITPTDAERLAGAITLQMGGTATLTADQVEVADYDGLTVSGGTISLVPIWRPTNERAEWSDTALWSGGTVPTSGNIVIDFSGLTEAKVVEIPNGAFTSVTFTGNAAESGCALTLTPVDGVTLGAMTINGRVSLPVTAVTGATSVLTGAQLTLSGTGTLSQNVTSTGTVALAANANLTLGSAGVLANTLTITGDATSAISTGAFIPSCILTNAGWQGTFKFTTNLGASDSAEENMKWSTLGSAYSKVVIPSTVTITGFFNSESWTLAAAVALDGTINLTNGYSGSGTGNTYTFSGALTGSGTFKHTSAANPANAVILQNASGFDGTLTIASSINRTFIIGTAHTYSNNNTTGDKGKIVIAGPVKASALSRWSAPNGIVFEGVDLDGGTAGITLSQKIVTNANAQPLTIRGKVTLTHVDCAFNGPVTVATNGSLTWKHNTGNLGGDRRISGDITIETGATFALSADYKWTTTLSGSLAGAGKLRAKVAQIAGQNDGTRLVEITAGCEDFTGTVELELSTTGGNSSTPRRSNLLLAPKDGKFNGNIAVQKINFSGDNPADTTENVSDAAWAYARVFFTGSCTFGGKVMGGLSVYVGKTTTNADAISDVSSAVEVAFSRREQPYTGKTTIASVATLKLSGNDALLGADSEASKVVVDGTLTCENPATEENNWTAFYRTVEGNGTIEVPEEQMLVIGTRWGGAADSGLKGFTGTLKVLGIFDARSWWSSTNYYDIGGFDVILGDKGKITRYSGDNNAAKLARLTIAANKTLSGNGTIEIPVIWNAAATLDATGATLDACTTFANTLDLAAESTMNVKVDEPSKLFSILSSNLTLAAGQIAITSDNTLPEGRRVAFFDKTVTNADDSTTQWATALLFVPPSVPASSDPETPRESGVDEAIAQAAGKMQIADGTVISEVTAITAQSATSGSGERKIDAAALFENVVTLTPGEQKENGTFPATATVAYDFGVSNITVVKLANAVENGRLSAGTQYVVVCAKVSNAPDESANTADYAPGIALKLLKNEGSEVPDVVEGVVEPTTDELAALRLSAAKGERWLAVPMTTLFPVNQETGIATGTMKLTVQATNGADTP